MSENALLKILDANLSDKGILKRGHHYHLRYGPDFSSLRRKKINILEVGIFTGTSHQTWIDFFPNAQVYGIDIFTRLQPKDVPVLKNDRCHYIKADSTSVDVGRLVKETFGDDIQFDIIIDDGLHTPDANRNTFENLMPFLKKTGYYYIEDIWPINILTKEESTHPWITKPKNAPLYSNLKYNEFLQSMAQYSTTHYDYREVSDLPDSYIIRIGKDLV